MSQGTWRMVDRQSPRHAPGVLPEAGREEAGAWWYAEDNRLDITPDELTRPRPLS